MASSPSRPRSPRSGPSSTSSSTVSERQAAPQHHQQSGRCEWTVRRGAASRTRRDVLDVLPAKEDSAKDLGVFNMASAVPFALAPPVAPVVLAIASGGYGVLHALAGACAVIGAIAILP